jgi:xylitol oxidase
MKRKEFLKKSAAALAGGVILPHWACSDAANSGRTTNQHTMRTNWAGNYTYQAEQLHEPTSVAEVQELVKALDRQKALGSRHCFNDIADSPGSQLSTRRLNQVVELDRDQRTLTVEAGARYGDFSAELHEQGYGLHNLASLPHITVAGACATGTHGSGVGNGNLATAVVALELVRPDGELVTLDRSHPDFPAVVVGLGAFGIITKVTLAVQDTYAVRQDVFLDLPLAALRTDFPAIMSSGYSVSLFTDWMDENVSEVWIKRRMDAEPADLGNDFYGATAATENIHPIVGLSADNCSEQMGVPGPWYARLPHFKMGFTPSAGKELQSEYFVPRENAVEAILAVERMKDRIYPHLMISEIRTIAADELWMSPCYQRDGVAIHFTWQQKPREVLALLPQIEAALAPFAVRPHWGKLFTLDPEVLQSRYPKYADFTALARQYDPEGKFRNHYLDTNIF